MPNLIKDKRAEKRSKSTMGYHRRGTSKELFAAMSNIKDSELRDQIYGSNEPIEVELPREVL